MNSEESRWKKMYYNSKKEITYLHKARAEDIRKSTIYVQFMIFMTGVVFFIGYLLGKAF